MLLEAYNFLALIVILFLIISYGDISPTTKKGRLMAVLWVVIGIVACSLFVAVVSSVLTTTCLSQTSDLRGNEASLNGVQILFV